MGCGFGVEGQNVEPRGEALDFVAGLDGALRFRRAVEQFGQDDSGDAERVRLGIELLPQDGRPVAQDVDADVGSQQMAQHQNFSGTCGSGCSRAGMSTPGASKTSSHKASAGAITRRAPSRRIRTSRTPSGKATSLGRRTPCERLDWNSLVRVTHA